MRPSVNPELRDNATAFPQGVVINKTPSPYQPTRTYAFGKCERGPKATSEMSHGFAPIRI